MFGWGGRIRTYDTRYQKPLPYRLATPQQRAPYTPPPSLRQPLFRHFSNGDALKRFNSPGHIASPIFREGEDRFPAQRRNRPGEPKPG